MIEQHVIAQLDATPIEDVAERLGIRVIRHKAICPFHDDSHPSLTFNIFRNRYRCYVCDAHGGVIDLVRNVRACGFRDACHWLGASSVWETNRPASKESFVNRPRLCRLYEASPNKELSHALAIVRSAAQERNRQFNLDLDWLATLLRPIVLNDDARHFLFDERHLDPRVIEWCRLSSITRPTPCWRYGKPFYDAPSLLIPYYDINGRLMSVQSRYLGSEDKPRFRFPRGSHCHIYNLQILHHLAPNEELWITEGCSDCWAMLSSGRKAIAIPSATLLKEQDLEPLRGLNLHMVPDRDKPGEKLFFDLRERLPQLVHHRLPAAFKDVGEWYSKINSNNG